MKFQLLCVFQLMVVSLVYCTEEMYSEQSIVAASRHILAADKSIEFDLTINEEDIQRRQLSILIGSILDLGSAVLNRLTDISKFDEVYNDVYRRTVAVSIVKYWKQPEEAYAVYQTRSKEPVELATEFKRIISQQCPLPVMKQSTCDCNVFKYVQGKSELEYDYHHTLMLGIGAKEYLRLETQLHEAAEVEGGAASFLLNGNEKLKPLVSALILPRLMNHGV